MLDCTGVLGVHAGLYRCVGVHAGELGAACQAGAGRAGGVLQQVDRSVCAQMQGRDGVWCIAAWEPDVCACRCCWGCVCPGK